MTSEALKADKQLFLHLHPSARTSRMRLSSIPFSWYLLLTLLPAVDDKASSCQWDPPMETFLCWDLFAGSDWANPLLVLARGMLCQSLSKPSLFTCLTGGPTIVLDKSVLPAVAGPLATVTGSSCHERFGCGEPTKGNTFQSMLVLEPWNDANARNGVNWPCAMTWRKLSAAARRQSLLLCANPPFIFILYLFKKMAVGTATCQSKVSGDTQLWNQTDLRPKTKRTAACYCCCCCCCSHSCCQPRRPEDPEIEEEGSKLCQVLARLAFGSGESQDSPSTPSKPK